jgi:hypothetical protein
LDVHQNIGLLDLYCGYNQLSASALNALFGTLHGETSGKERKAVLIWNNPGEKDCDQGIATAKGWTVN